MPPCAARRAREHGAEDEVVAVGEARASRSGTRPSGEHGVEVVRAHLAAVGPPDRERQLVAAGRRRGLLDVRARLAQGGRRVSDGRDGVRRRRGEAVVGVDRDVQPARSTCAGSPSATGATPPSRAVGPGEHAAAAARRPRPSARAAPTCVRGSLQRAERPLVVDHAGDRDAARGRLERGQAAEVRGQPRARARVGAEPAGRAARGDDRGLAAAAAAGRAVEVVGVVRAAVDRVVGLDAAAPRRAVRLAEQDRAGGPQPRDRGRVASPGRRCARSGDADRHREARRPRGCPWR